MRALRGMSKARLLSAGKRSRHWGSGRRVIIRPDVPGGDTKSSASIFVKTDDDRKRLQQALHQLYREKSNRVGRKGRVTA